MKISFPSSRLSPLTRAGRPKLRIEHRNPGTLYLFLPANRLPMKGNRDDVPLFVLEGEHELTSNLYKYQTINKNSLENLINKKLYFANTSQFNDPFDGQLLPSDFVREIKDLGYNVSDSEISKHDQFVADRLNGYGVLSLSKKRDDILMWSHYADSHKGFCFGFKENLSSYFDDHDWPIDHKTVRYSRMHPFIDIHDDLISKKRFNSNDTFLNLCELGQALLDAAITIKHSSWSYEVEERIVSEVSGLHSFRPEALDHIVLGMNISMDDEATVCSLLKNSQWRHVNLFKAKRGKAALTVEIIPIQGT